jgi:hypothetical protein
MRLITIALSMIFLASCQSVERRAVCSELRKQEIKTIEMCDISIKFDRCRCRSFNLNSWTELSEPVNHPLAYCDKMVGFKADAAALEVRPKVKAMYRLKENLCQ